MAVKLSPETQFVILACRTYFGTSDLNDVRVFIENNPSLDWQKVYELSARHKIRPVVLEGLGRDFVKTLPAEFSEQIHQSVLHSAIRNLMITQEFLELSALFEQYGIKTAPHKGAYLANRFYGNNSLREMGDIDLLIPKRHILRAKEILTERGYTMVDFNSGTDYSLEMEYSLSHDYTLQFYYNQNNKRHALETHWQFAHHWFSHTLTFEDIEDQTVGWTLNQQKIQVLPPDWVLLTTILHHGSKDTWAEFKLMADLAAIITAKDVHFDWDDILQKAMPLRIKDALLIGFYLVNHYFGIEIPAQIQEQIKQDGIEKLAKVSIAEWEVFRTTTKGGTILNVIFALRTRQSWAEKWEVLSGFVGFALRPNRHDLQLVKLPKALHFLFFFTKSYRYLFRK